MPGNLPYLILLCCAFAVPAAAVDSDEAVNKLLDRIAEQEQFFIQELHTRPPSWNLHP